jgi:DNA polymerase-3 subunit epsilon
MLTKSNIPAATYAIVDIETSGSYASGSGITEIAIFIHDGEKVIDRYEQLINPQQPIPLAIQALTGITNEMVADAPTFREVAAELYRWLSPHIFVAHNVNFDYSFLRHHFELAGFKYAPPKLCTIRMARRLTPGLPSYSLGRLCHSLNIPTRDRHRAGGDAEATAHLFGQLLQLEEGREVVAGMLKKQSSEQQLPPHVHKSCFDALPNSPGIYYFYNQKGKIIYIGKARQIAKRVRTHFTGHNPNPQRQHFIREIADIRFEICGSELQALLLECMEIKKYWPIYNRALKRFEPKFGLFDYYDQKGYRRLAIGKKAKHQPSLLSFYKADDAIRQLRHMIEQFDLHPKRCQLQMQGYHPQQLALMLQSPTREEEDQAHYNQKVEASIQYQSAQLPSFIFVDNGRNEDEKALICIDKGQFYGMGYRDLDLAGDYEEIKEGIPRCQGNEYMLQLVLQHAYKYPHKILRPR